MKYLHWEMNASPDNVIRVELDRQANVLLMDDLNFNSFRNGQSHRYFGGLAKQSPATLVPPHTGHWNVVVNLGSYPGSVKASVSVM